ncbi:nitroreductase/quinone reductase family protein [Streptantibioticus ferralitis]|uniref:Nitroreductase/quinone reductase family protein n=1 Tax=Streptantibioticus ferralitis TaxID=236510 RepID=A0ABT5ZAG6_9ACTN|nr:nitroreductase/quinone reductase family protein [Streptantibioticus ferralitis]MDF2260627.1 nitroreductase/quinone reductase family protein [Streptantibioticus ferralitis]
MARGGPLGRIRPVIQTFSSSRAFAKVAPHVIPALDRLLYRLTGGKVLLGARMLTSAVLTSTGARSGQPRHTPLACMRAEDGTYVLVGSNFGRPGHPAWTGNLIRNPQARINWKGRDIPVTAALLEGAERAQVWEAVVRFWPPYASYAARVEREIRLFRLTPRD